LKKRVVTGKLLKRTETNSKGGVYHEGNDPSNRV
jgi:hypothetical protein